MWKYDGVKILEGFCANTEKPRNRDPDIIIQNEFYQMCVIDNEMIINLTSEDEISIPQLTLTNLTDIIFKRLKSNKACDIYKITFEYLRFAGDENLSLLLILLKRIIADLNNLSSQQLNTAVATVVHKGKGKPVNHHKSYCQVRVSTLVVVI